MSNPFEQTVIYLLHNEPFYACLLQQFRRKFNDPKVQTAAVGIENGGITIFINESFFNSLSLLERVDILKHECMHVIGDHFERALASNGKGMDHLFNVAGDLAINQYLLNIPKKFEINGETAHPVTFESLKKMIPDAKLNMATEYYYDLLKKKQDELIQKMKDAGLLDENGNPRTIDDHSKWTDSENTKGQNKETISQIRENALKKASEGAESIKAGSTPADVLLQLDAMIKSKINWRSQLQRFVANTTETKIDSTRKRRNRRFGIDLPGNKFYPDHHMAVVMDTSGSCCTQEVIDTFMGEINGIYKAGSKITMITVDTEVKDIQEYEPKKKPKIRGGGGTLYQPALDACNELDVDGIIFLGDMECFDGNLKKPNMPILWTILGGSNKPADWGYELRIPLK